MNMLEMFSVVPFAAFLMPFVLLIEDTRAKVTIVIIQVVLLFIQLSCLFLTRIV